MWGPEGSLVQKLCQPCCCTASAASCCRSWVYPAARVKLAGHLPCPFLSSVEADTAGPSVTALVHTSAAILPLLGTCLRLPGLAWLVVPHLLRHPLWSPCFDAPAATVTLAVG